MALDPRLRGDERGESLPAQMKRKVGKALSPLKTRIALRSIRATFDQLVVNFRSIYRDLQWQRLLPHPDIPSIDVDIISLDRL